METLRLVPDRVEMLSAFLVRKATSVDQARD
jgi:hypothetical protein